MMKLSSIVVALLVAFTMGCASTVDPGEEGTGTYTWQQRELKGTVTASTADGSRVRIKLKAMDFESTRFNIKVGNFGDKAMSQQVARYVARELAEGE